MAKSNDLHDFEQGDFLEAADLNALVALLRRGFSAPNMAFDVDGIYHRRKVDEVTTLRPFELKDELTLGGSAEAYDLLWVSSNYVAAVDQKVFVVHDTPMERFRGWERTTDPARDGARGWAVYNSESEQWEIVAMQNVARSITFELTEKMGESFDNGASMTVDDFYRGENPDGIFLALGVFDPQILFPWALNGAKGKATFDDVDQQYHITECEQIARSINFTISEDDAIGANDVEVTYDDWYHGQDPAIHFDSAALRKVFDPQGLFPRALTGAKGKARWDDRTGEYHVVECQQMATMIKSAADGDVDAGDGTISVAPSVTVMNPITGQDPETGNETYDPVELGANNTFAEEFKSGDTIIIAWNEEDNQWETIAPDGNKQAAQWAVAQIDWEDMGVNHPRVKCKDSDSDGNTTGNDFYVLLPRSTDQDPAIYAGNILVYEVTDDGKKVCVSDYMNGKVGDIREISSVAKIPEGWGEIDAFAHRVTIGRDANGEDNEKQVGDQGGFRWHGKTDEDGESNNHAHHTFETKDSVDDVDGQAVAGPLGEVATTSDAATFSLGWGRSLVAFNASGVSDIYEHAGPGQPRPEAGEIQPTIKSDDTDNRMPFVVVIKIVRFK